MMTATVSSPSTCLSLIQPDGAGNHVMLGPPGDQVHPDWSPDGSQIAYVQRDETGAQQILITVVR
jgi:Tol biopolymer transport system component